MASGFVWFLRDLEGTFENLCSVSWTELSGIFCMNPLGSRRIWRETVGKNPRISVGNTASTKSPDYSGTGQFRSQKVRHHLALERCVSFMNDLQTQRDTRHHIMVCFWGISQQLILFPSLTRNATNESVFLHWCSHVQRTTPRRSRALKDIFE